MKSANFKVRHVFSDVAKRMEAHHRSELDKFMPELDAKGRPVDIEAAKYNFHKMAKYLKDHGTEIFGRDTCSKTCLSHPGKSCQVSLKDSDSLVRPIVSSFAGPMCTPWSAYGSKLGEAHPCMESY